MKHMLISCFLCISNLFVAFSGNNNVTDKGNTGTDNIHHFDTTGISRKTLEYYLQHSVTMSEFLIIDPLQVDGLYPYKEDDVRLIKNIGAKFIGRAIYRWGREDALNNSEFLEHARQLIEQVHAFDPEVVFQAGLFEIVTESVNQIAIPAWAFEAMGLAVEQRNFDYSKMLNVDGKLVEQWRKGSSVPDITQQETQLWFMFLSGQYISIGCEAIHLGQTALIGMADLQLLHWKEFIDKLRKYARTATRRGWILLDAHVPTHGMVVDGQSLLDFNTFPLRIKEIPDKPQQAMLEMDYLDSLYGRSKGCITPSGWACASLPYLVEFDNFNCSRTPGQSTIDSHFIWGYDEISWFYQQSKDDRKEWLRYSYHWVGEHDPNGFLQMPVSRVVQLCGTRGRTKFRANTHHTSTMPDGLNLEETIKMLWGKHRIGEEYLHTERDILFFHAPLILKHSICRIHNHKRSTPYDGYFS
jgi:hypothetical protein